jgi:hypothetical protein
MPSIQLTPHQLRGFGGENDEWRPAPSLTGRLEVQHVATVLKLQV